ncbi:19103_t:CDS:2 [Racocetra fulgida]|uniref:19103_t:CDS:1 n=1 Tax=Racocetra fulgida TaxID=60492 RepID=A0A9N9AQT9_9GLOM|nr:19103_t:CDS:2 [Racocetra fulgida]
MSNVFGPERPKVDGGFERDSEEDLLKQMNKVPLFMTELPEEENDALAALQSLIYEGPPEGIYTKKLNLDSNVKICNFIYSIEIAENFKNQGNECFKAGKSQYQDAINYYTKALETNCQDNKIIGACLTNRAAVNLELLLTDCAKAIKLNPRSIKAFYRSAKALHALDKIDQALDCCEHGLRIEPNNLALQQLKETCVKRKEIMEQKARIKEERERKERGTREALENAIKIRNIKMETTPNAPISPHSVHIDTETQQLIWPVFFLYPEYKESDFIEAFNEENTFLDHLEVIFEQLAPWDIEHKYTPDNLQIYYEYTLSTGNEEKQKLIRIGKNCTLKEVLSHPKYVVKNGIPNFIILQRQGKFQEEFLTKYKS